MSQDTVIVGCGIIGITTAYHLLDLGLEGSEIHIVEAASKAFEGASGYSGGFLASNWYAPNVLPLGELSFSLHKELADRHDGFRKWGYAPSTGISLGSPENGDEEGERAEDWLLAGTSRSQVADHNSRSKAERHDQHAAPKWLRKGQKQRLDVLSEGDSTGQVDPLKLCSFLLSYCESKGVTFSYNCTVTSLQKDADNTLQGINLSNGTSLPCSRLVFTTGPWTSQLVQKLFPSSTKLHQALKIGALAGHSIIVRSPHWRNDHSDSTSTNALGSHAVFATSFTTSKRISGSQTFAPEIFSRHPDEIYVAGLNTSNAKLPDRADEREIDPQAIEALKEAAAKILYLEDTNDVEVVRQGFCFRPTTGSGRPVIAHIPDDSVNADCSFGPQGGVWVSAGHGPWGISLSSGTGRILAEMVLGVKTSIDVSPYALRV